MTDLLAGDHAEVDAPFRDLALGFDRGGGVQRAAYPAGGSNPLARLFYVELTRRF